MCVPVVPKKMAPVAAFTSVKINFFLAFSLQLILFLLFFQYNHFLMSLCGRVSFEESKWPKQTESWNGSGWKSPPGSWSPASPQPCQGHPSAPCPQCPTHSLQSLQGGHCCPGQGMLPAPQGALGGFGQRGMCVAFQSLSWHPLLPCQHSALLPGC